MRGCDLGALQWLNSPAHLCQESTGEAPVCDCWGIPGVVQGCCGYTYSSRINTSMWKAFSLIMSDQSDGSMITLPNTRPRVQLLSPSRLPQSTYFMLNGVSWIWWISEYQYQPLPFSLCKNSQSTCLFSTERSVPGLQRLAKIFWRLPTKKFDNHGSECYFRTLIRIKFWGRHWKKVQILEIFLECKLLNLRWHRCIEYICI